MPYRIDYQKKHKNAKGECVPWVLVNEDRDEIVGNWEPKRWQDPPFGLDPQMSNEWPRLPVISNAMTEKGSELIQGT